MIVIVCSSEDPASMNIFENLLGLRKWSERPPFLTCGRFAIMRIGEPLLYQDGIDARIKDLGIDPELIVFASKHKSESGRPTLSVHFTGNVDDALYGGRPRELAVPAPHALRSALITLHSICPDEATMECTHHGPSNLSTPSMFIEIGSTEERWADPSRGRIVAEAILSIVPEGREKVAVGFGGGHYAPKQTDVLLKYRVAFGHVFPTYQIGKLTPDIIGMAFRLSNADFGFIDKKSMRGDERRMLERMINDAGYDVITEKELAAP